MTRRLFVMKLLTWSKMAVMLSLFPSSFLKAANDSERESSTHLRPKGLSLREIALRKIHHANGRFQNPFSEVSQGGLWPVIKWKLFSKNQFKDLYNQEHVVPLSIDWEPVRRNRGLSITFLKHASVMIKDLDKYILVDPVFFTPSRLIKDFTPLTFDIKEMPRPDHLLITHGHYDHLDTPTLNSFAKETHMITPLGYNEIFRDLGMNRRIQMDWYDTFQQGKREITLLPCNHWTMRNPLMGPNLSLWGSYLIKTASGPTIFISGDTAYFEDFREIGEEYPIDLAIINLGAYEPRWFMAASHMNPSEAVKAFRQLHANHLLIVHWGTFRLGDEPVHHPPIQLRLELEKAGLLDRLVHLNHGETLSYNI